MTTQKNEKSKLLKGKQLELPVNKQSAFVKSKFARRENDHYPTIDTRAVDAWVKFFGDMNTTYKNMHIVDVCADQGSAIVDYLKELGYGAWGVPDAFQNRLYEHPLIKPDWIVTNTPYERPLVEKIIERQIERVEAGEVKGAAFLLRSTFDHAASRFPLFSSKLYTGQIKIMARLWWTEIREVSPIHNYSWFVFAGRSAFAPVVHYYKPPYNPLYAADNMNFKCRACGHSGKNKGDGRIKRTSLGLVERCEHCGDLGYSLEVE
jgi:hypothetical protein